MLNACAFGAPLISCRFRGDTSTPAILERAREATPAFTARVLHWGLGLAIACLVAAHIGAALYHHFLRRDRILLRMITG